ncbi:MAG: carotenoid 1,2-hydratase [Rhodobacteraceae bacterium]|nr:carotenoid 1,2-hydratase [Paracoccaceae bacterium]
MIGFIGSVFSPWYRWSGRRAPEDNCCINVATYGPGGRFTMTDRGAAALRRSRRELHIGPSRMAWADGRLVIDIDEWAAPPLPGRVRGRVVVTPSALSGFAADLDSRGRHVWRPFAPVARIDVDLNRGWRWQGHGYLDGNFGTAALEADFRRWTWGRYPTGEGTAVFYDATRRDGGRLDLAMRFAPDGTACQVLAPPPARFGRTLWGLRRQTRADPGFRPRQIRSLLDAPFYARALVETRLEGELTQGVHEVLDLDRFASPLLMPMLALRVPRRRAWRHAGAVPGPA